MSKITLINSIELTVNTTLKRINQLNGLDKKALESEFSEWLTGIDNSKKNYDVLYINKICR